jgi:hypothetical protein
MPHSQEKYISICVYAYILMSRFNNREFENWGFLNVARLRFKTSPRSPLRYEAILRARRNLKINPSLSCRTTPRRYANVKCKIVELLRRDLFF